MKFNDIQKKTGKLLIINKNILRTFEKNENTLNNNIKYWLKTKRLIALKNGVYIFSEKYKNENNKDFYFEYIANSLLKPSYLSLEYVMAKNQLLTDAVYTVTSITTKTTREFTNSLGTFRYYNIIPELFFGYKTIFVKNIPINVASKAKAVFDYIYLRFIKNSKINENVIKELRINWENLNKNEFAEFCSYISRTKSKNLTMLLLIIKKLYF